MSIVTLTTDFGTKDFSVASVKASLLREIPNANIVDISHEVSPFNIGEAAYIIKNVYKDFPEGSIHIIGVDALPNENKKLLAAKINEHYFLVADNGILSLILSDIDPQELFEITLNKYKSFSNFTTKDIFAPIACHLLRGGTLNIVGTPTKNYKVLNTLKPQIKENSIIGTVIYIDNFGNAITNISKKSFDENVRGKNYEIFARGQIIKRLVNRYSDIVSDFNQEVRYHGEGMALFNSSDFLEIAIYKPNLKTYGGASSLIGLSIGSSVIVNFN